MRFVVEGLVIVVSILAAFALDTSWERVQERENEQETLIALGSEFRDARAEIERRRAYQRRILAAVSTVADSLHRALEEGRPSLSVSDTLLGLAYIPPTTSVGLGTLQGLIGSGQLGVIKSRDLRARLGAWGTELDELREEELDSRALAYGEFDRTLRERMNTYGLWAIGDSIFNDALSAAAAGQSRALPVDTEVLGVFHLRASLLTHGVDEFDPLLEAVATILRLIERDLGP